MSFGTCSCGKPIRYSTPDGKGSCNKRVICPTYSELEDDIKYLKSKLETLEEHSLNLIRYRDGYHKHVDAVNYIESMVGK